LIQLSFNEIRESIKIKDIYKTYITGISIDKNSEYTISIENDIITIQKKHNDVQFIKKYIFPFKISNTIGLFISDYYIYHIYKNKKYIWENFPVFNSNLEREICKNTTQYINRKIYSIYNGFMNFEENLQYKIQIANEYIKKNYKDILSDKIIERLSYLAAFKTYRWYKIIPLLLDDNINEIYLDRIDKYIYIDHAVFGRCITQINLTEDEIDAFITRIRVDNDLVLNKINPSLKVDFNNNLFKTRINLDIYPFVDSKVALIIRRFKNKNYNILDLIKMKTITKQQAALILIFIGLRFSITISGIPGSGKTTLMNAIDQLLPSSWRRIYIEDVRESNLFDANQLRIKVKPFDNVSYLKTKSTETIKVLHRTPDILFLGEIQTKEHSIALLEALLSGIQVIHTIHSNNIQNLLYRLNTQHNIDSEALNALGLIIQMDKPSKDRPFRFIKEIAIIKNNEVINIDDFKSAIKILNISKIKEKTLMDFYEKLVDIFENIKDIKQLKEELDKHISNFEDLIY